MTQPAKPFPASTVALLRPSGDGGIEVLMHRRPHGMDAYGGVYVFPGGRLDEDDCSESMRRLVRGLSPVDAQHLLGAELSPELSLGYWIAAARELFEEAGIHLFCDENGSTLVSSPGLLLEQRQAVQRGHLAFSDLLQAVRLYCDLRHLIYFFHRITPEHYPIRFDTRFFLAALPPHQTPLPTSEEVAESLWVTPKAALGRLASGHFPMMPPTVAVLRLLAEHGSWDALSRAFPRL